MRGPAMLGFLAIPFGDIGKRHAERRRSTIGSAIPKSEAVESGYVEHSSSPTDTVHKNTVRGDEASVMPSCHQLLKNAPSFLRISLRTAPKIRECGISTHEFKIIASSKLAPAD